MALSRKQSSIRSTPLLSEIDDQTNASVVTESAGAFALELESISKRYAVPGGGQRVVLPPTELRVKQGSFVSIIGHSGCGKTTLLRIVAGLTAASSGLLRIDGQPTVGASPLVRYLFQDCANSLLPWSTVRGNVLFGLRHSQAAMKDKRLRAATCDDYLRRVGLEGFGDSYPWQLSGGMQQRLALARALISNPEVLLMDEPFSSVDAITRGILQDEILTIWGETRITVLFVTHDLEEAVYLSDRVLVLGQHGQGIIADMTIDLPRPRSQIETKETPSYHVHRRELFSLLSTVRGEDVR